ncbi:hypothetical protein N9W89_05360 [Hellea sp.]|nr:hypothetical protein [Hellea sp.]
MKYTLQNLGTCLNLTILSLFLGGCANALNTPQDQNSNIYSVSLTQIEQQRETLNLKQIKTSGHLVYRDDNDRFTKGFFLLYEGRLDDDRPCSLDRSVTPLLILRSELPKKYRNFTGEKVTVSGVFENKYSESFVLSGSKYNIHAGRNGPLEKAQVLTVEINEKCQGF